MEYLFDSGQFRRSVRCLATTALSTVLLVGVGIVWPAEERPETRQRFIELDSEIQAIKADILAINRDILLLEELSLNVQGQQLVVLVSVATKNPVNLERVTLQLDGNSVIQYDYSVSEAAALKAGGVHRLYTSRLTAGDHRFDVVLSGRYSRHRNFAQQRSVNMIKKPGRTFMELHLEAEEGRSEPGVSIREWQP